MSKAIQWLNTSYSIWFNRRHNRSGHLFQGRFKSVVVDPESWGLEISRYLHLNPVRLRSLGLGKSELRGSRVIGLEKVNQEQLCQRFQVLRRYPWSSYRCYIGLMKVPPWLTASPVLNSGGRAKQPAEQYRQYCEGAIRQGAEESPWVNVLGQVVLGTERFVSRLAKTLAPTGTGARLKQRPTLDQIIQIVEAIRKEKWEQFRDRHGDGGRDLVLYLGRKAGGLSFRTLSERVEIGYPSATGAVRRFSGRVAKGRKLAAVLRQALTQMIAADAEVCARNHLSESIQ